MYHLSVNSWECFSPAVDDEDSDGEAKPPKKKAQVDLRKFFGKSKEDEPETKPPTPSKVAGMRPKPKALPAKKPVAKKAVESDEGESDVEVGPVVKAKPKPAPPKKAAPSKPSKKVVSDEDDDEMDVEPAPAKRDAPKRAARAAPKKYIDVTSDDDDDGGEYDAYELSD